MASLEIHSGGARGLRLFSVARRGLRHGRRRPDSVTLSGRGLKRAPLVVRLPAARFPAE